MCFLLSIIVESKIESKNFTYFSFAFFDSVYAFYKWEVALLLTVAAL